nr:hypothetical protein [Tanacetum cinerariifolium]
DSDDEGNGDEDLGLNVGREEGHDEKEEEDELYRDVNINQGRGIQTIQEFEDSHVTLTPVNPDENLGINVGQEERHDEEAEEDELYRGVNINQGRGIQMTQEIKDSHVTLTPVNPDGMESIFETTSQMDAQTPTSVAPLPMSAPTITPSTIATITTTSQAPTPHTTAPSSLIQDLPNFGSLFGFDNRLRTLEANFLEFMQTNQFVKAVSAILGIVQ